EPVVRSREDVTANLEVDQEAQIKPFPGERVVKASRPVSNTITDWNIFRGSNWPAILKEDRITVRIALLNPTCDHTIRIANDMLDKLVPCARLFTNYLIDTVSMVGILVVVLSLVQ